MSDFKNEIKTLTEKEKEEVFYIIFTSYLQNGIIGKQIEKKDIMKEIQEKYGQMISPDEIIATANISEQLIKMCVLPSYFKRTAKRQEFVDYIYLNHVIKKENVLKLVNATIGDIIGTRKYSKKQTYEFNVDRVMDIINGRDPYRIHKEEFMAQEARKKFKVVK